MPLVAHTELPTFQRLRDEGEEILSAERAKHQDIREMHIGLLNMMPDAALEATERQFFRLVGASNQIVQIHMHPFTIDGLERSPSAQDHINRYYEPFEQIKRDGLDALIVSGANVTHPRLPEEVFWQPLTEVFDWAKRNVTSILCSCLATHALVQYCHNIERTRLPAKRWGVFSHRVVDRHHPLVVDINTRFDVPHSRFNEVFRRDMEAAGLKVLVESTQAGVHLAVSKDLFRVVYFQGHPEYDAISLMKEYKREVLRYFHGQTEEYPPYPEHYFDDTAQQVFAAYRHRLESAKRGRESLPEFPEDAIKAHLDNTWRDTAKAVFNNWLGKIYQITDQDRRVPFMEHIDPDNPLGLL
ncbi:MAG: homoserine O-succinyltransferase [Pseudomonadota bacterium]